MSRDPAIQVVGLNRLQRTLRQAGVDLTDMSEVNYAVGSIVVAAQKAYGPYRSGDLVRSARPSRAKGRARVLLGRASVPYAGAVHWGAKKNPPGRFLPNPWVSRTAERTENRWRPQYERGVQDVVNKVEGA